MAYLFSQVTNRLQNITSCFAYTHLRRFVYKSVTPPSPGYIDSNAIFPPSQSLFGEVAANRRPVPSLSPTCCEPEMVQNLERQQQALRDSTAKLSCVEGLLQENLEATRELTRAVGRLAALQQNKTMSSEKSCQNLVNENAVPDELCYLNTQLCSEEYYSNWIETKIKNVNDQDDLIIII